MGEKGDLEAGTDRSDRADSFSSPLAVERRVWRNIFIVLIIAVAIASAVADLRFVYGLVVGGALSLFNYRWLHASLRGTLAVGGEKAPPGTVMKFVFRWLIVAMVVYAAYSTGYVDPVAMLSGLFAPALAVMLEAGYVTYKTLTGHGGEG